MEELKACPFCGKKDTVDFTTCVETEDCVHFEECPEEEPYYCVVCNIHKGGCGASGGFAPTRQEAVEKWDRRTAPENKPLTLEQLRQMDGEPVWVHEITPEPIDGDYWGIVDIGVHCINNFGIGAVISGSNRGYGAAQTPFIDYGKTWLAYARRPEAPK